MNTEVIVYRWVYIDNTFSKWFMATDYLSPEKEAVYLQRAIAYYELKVDESKITLHY